MKKPHWIPLTVVILAAAASVAYWATRPSVGVVGRGPRDQGVYDVEPQDDVVPSPDLAADLKAMWRTVPSQGSDFEVSPVSAINAASRVFATVKLEGKTREEVLETLQYDQRQAYGYNFPFYPADSDVLVLRFDCGSFGWQFDIHFDDQGRVRSVERQGIE